MLKGIHLTLLMGAAELQPAPREVIDALTSIKVSSTAGTGAKGAKPGGFQLVFTLGKNSPFNRNWVPVFLDSPLLRMVIVVTVKGRPHVIMDGVIVRHEFSPSNDAGQSTLTVTGEDLTRLMDLVDATGFPFPAIPNEGRVALLLAKYAAFGVVPKIVPSVFVNVPNPISKIESQQGTDLEYITMLANLVGYVFYIEQGPTPGMNVAYWGPETKTGSPQPSLIVNSDAKNNASLGSISFESLSRTLFIALVHNEFSGVTYPIPVPDITPINPPLGREMPPPLRVRQIRDLIEEKKEGVAKMPPIQVAAVALAKASKSSEVIGGKGSVDVVRYGNLLKPRQLVEVRGAGGPLDGTYFVSGVTHDIGRGTYTQNFTLTRNALYPVSQQANLPRPASPTLPAPA